jgi:hypothetical protein
MSVRSEKMERERREGILAVAVEIRNEEKNG